MSAPAQAPRLLPPVSRRRVVTDKVMRAIVLASIVVALIPLVLTIYYVAKRGISTIDWDFFTTDPTGRSCISENKALCPPAGGVKSAIVGTITMVALATAIAVPIGVGVALYLIEFGKATWFAKFVRYFVDVLTGVPSVVFGLFVYIVLVVTQVGGDSFAGWKGSVALALLMLPIVARSAEVVLNLVPESLREAALALGATRWRVVFRIVLPTALPGLITGSLLAVARAAGETAPLLFTAAVAFGSTANIGERMNSLPVQIFNDIQNPQARIVDRAWASALTVIVLVLIISLLARLISRRSRLA
jgi:phosphate transport system permease protein